MANFHLKVSVVSRGHSSRFATTRNAVAMAAYQAREELEDERYEVTRGPVLEHRDLIHSEILLPENAPSRWLDRQTLWNEVEARENRRDAQLARAVVVSIPRELPMPAGVDLAREFVLRSFVDRGMVADFAVHSPLASDGKPQPHAHALLTMRRIVEGEFGAKERGWNAAKLVKSWRVTWADMANRKLAESGIMARIDHRARRAVAAAGQVGRDAARAAVRVPEMVRRVGRRVLDYAERVEGQPMAVEDAQAEFARALQERGLRLTGDPVMDGRFHRTAVEGDRGSKRSGSYLGYLDGRPAGYINNFKTGESGPWKAGAGEYVVPDAEKLAADRQARAAERAIRQDAAADAAARIWNRAAPAPASHPYLERKGIGGEGLRVTGRGDLVVPMQDADGRLWNLQQITPDGEKYFLRKGRGTGTHAVVGDIRPGEPLVVAEGYSTARTIHEATGLAVVAAMNAGNLEAVAQAYRARDPGRTIVIAADNDQQLTLRDPPLPNVGLEKAQTAARAVGGRVIAPSFALGDAGTDWNDYARLHGQGAVRGAFAKEGLGMKQQVDAAAAAEATVTQVQREAARTASAGLVQAADQEAQEASRRAQAAAQRTHALTQ